MKVQVVSVSSIMLIPESDSDRAVLMGLKDMASNKTLSLAMQSYSVGDGRIHDMFIGFGPARTNLAARKALERARLCVSDSYTEELIDAALESLN